MFQTPWISETPARRALGSLSTAEAAAIAENEAQGLETAEYCDAICPLCLSTHRIAAKCKLRWMHQREHICIRCHHDFAYGVATAKGPTSNYIAPRPKSKGYRPPGKRGDEEQVRAKFSGAHRNIGADECLLGASHDDAFDSTAHCWRCNEMDIIEAGTPRIQYAVQQTQQETNEDGKSVSTTKTTFVVMCCTCYQVASSNQDEFKATSLLNLGFTFKDDRPSEEKTKHRGVESESDNEYGPDYKPGQAESFLNPEAPVLSGHTPAVLAPKGISGPSQRMETVKELEVLVLPRSMLTRTRFGMCYTSLLSTLKSPKNSRTGVLSKEASMTLLMKIRRSIQAAM